MHIHILGICGTFMGGIATIARQLGHRVTGSDAHVYPPMSTMLASLDIEIGALDDVSQLDPAPDLVIIGNALSRGNAQVEAVLNRNLPYTSGPQWLGDNVLRQKWVLAVAGTHGKTTTSSMLASILDYAGLQPGFLIGGVVEQFAASARLTESMFFVIEADEYDTAFFDKRSKFVHYHPNTLAINNLEFDHADIFPDLASIQRQFHHLVRTVPGQGCILAPQNCTAIAEVLQQGLWSELQPLNSGSGWKVNAPSSDGSSFSVAYKGEVKGQVNWNLLGQHNMENALMAVAAAHNVGVPIAVALEALAQFKAPKRRMEQIFRHGDLVIYDDFAHHPTAMRSTLQGLRAHVADKPIWAVIEPRSNTMRAGVHKDQLAESLALADQVVAFDNGQLDWSLQSIADGAQNPWFSHSEVPSLVDFISQQVPSDAHIVLMSNGGFSGLREQLIAAMKKREK